MNIASSAPSKLRRMVAVAVFCALAYVCTMVFHFKVAFLSFDLKDAVMTIGSMSFGPLAGLFMAVIVALLELVTISTTGVYGFIMNIIASVSFVCVGSLIYKYKRSMTGAVIGMIASVAAMTGVMMAANLVITPFYMHCTTGEVAAMIPTLLLPFNATKATLNAALVFILYKPISYALKSAGFVSNFSETKTVDTVSAKKFIVPIIAFVVAIAALVFFFVVLKGSFTLK